MKPRAIAWDGENRFLVVTGKRDRLVVGRAVDLGPKTMTAEVAIGSILVQGEPGEWFTHDLPQERTEEAIALVTAAPKS